MIFKIEYVSGGRAWSYCPFHDDTHRPNVSITLYGKYGGRWKCWACNKSGTLSDGEMSLLNIEPLKEYNTHSSNYRVRWGRLITSYKENLNRFPLLREGLVHELNIQTRLLNHWDVGYDGQAFTIPMLEDGQWVGVQRRFPDGKKCCITGSKLGVMGNNSCGVWKNMPLFICEGFTDAIAVGDLGFSSIARPHCHFVEGVIDYLNYGDEGYGDEGEEEEEWNNIIIVPDNDAVGIEGANNLLDSIRKNVSFYDRLDMFEFSGAKDVRELIKLKGKDKVKTELERLT